MRPRFLANKRSKSWWRVGQLQRALVHLNGIVQLGRPWSELVQDFGSVRQGRTGELAWGNDVLRLGRPGELVQGRGVVRPGQPRQELV